MTILNEATQTSSFTTWGDVQKVTSTPYGALPGDSGGIFGGKNEDDRSWRQIIM